MTESTLNLGNGTRGLSLSSCRWTRAGSHFQAQHSGAHNRIGTILRRAYKHGVCPCEMAKAVSEGGAERDPSGRPSFLLTEKAGIAR